MRRAVFLSRWPAPHLRQTSHVVEPHRAGEHCLDAGLGVQTIFGITMAHSWLLQRTLAASEQLGLQSLVAFIRKRPNASDYYIGGLSRLSQAGQKFVTIASTASFVADAFIVEVADDDRVPLRRQHLVNTMEEEMVILASIPVEVWSIMASPLVDVTGAALQSTILKAAHVSIAFISVRCLHPASRAPWHLCGGDLALNLEALRGQPQPSEPTTCKVWQLLQLGYNVPQLLLAVRTLQDCPWSTVHVEQGHAHASGVAKAHGQYGPSLVVPESQPGC